MPINPMQSAREIIENHIKAGGTVTAPLQLQEAIAEVLGFIELASIPHRAVIDEADALIANLIGVGEFMGAYPEGASKEEAIENWKRRCILRAEPDEECEAGVLHWDAPR